MFFCVLNRQMWRGGYLRYNGVVVDVFAIILVALR